MRTWFYRHPNVTLVLIGAAWLVVVTVAIQDFHERRWGFSAAFAIASFSVGNDFRKVWKRT